MSPQIDEQIATLPQMLRQVVSQRADQDALVTPGESLSYAELDARTAMVARALLAAGAGKGTRIALMAPDGNLWITTFLASMRIGALLTVVSTLCTPSELRHILCNSDTQFFIGARRFLRHNYAEVLCTALPGLATGCVGRLRLVDAPYLRAIWLDDAYGLSWAWDVDELIAQANADDTPDVALLNAVEAQVVPADDAVIIYTSGSTSKPKAVVHTQRNIVAHPRALASYFLLKPSDRMMPLLPAFWLGGLVMALETLSIGATLVYPGSPETEAVLDAIEQLGVNRINSWGDMLVKLRTAAIERGIDVDRIVGLGLFRDRNGQLIPPPLQANILGMSETFAVHSAEPIDCRLPETKAGASGRTVNSYERRIVDPDSGKKVALGEIGELQLRGGALMSGFYKRERSEVFTADGFYPTNDLVREDADGYLYFVARRGDMIKTKAANVSRLEVEAALVSLPGVAMAVVVGLPDEELGQRVAAAVVADIDVELTADAIKRALKQLLSSYKIPRDIVFVDAGDIPRTATGKIRLADVGALIVERVVRSKPASDNLKESQS